MKIDEYPREVYIAFVKALEGKRNNFDKLIADGYPEWAAFAAALQGDDEATMFLLTKSALPVLGVLANGMNDEPAAMSWLKKNSNRMYYAFCQATKKDDEAKEWLASHDYLIFVMLAEKINEMMKIRIKRETFWYHGANWFTGEWTKKN
ncbi:MAG: hypothetical protein LBR45_02275 [Bacteroidales bacterium]|jgi:hypothetical protein|nr:hypothetical protein [Bacteroidales bacterium]